VGAALFFLFLLAAGDVDVSCGVFAVRIRNQPDCFIPVFILFVKV